MSPTKKKDGFTAEEKAAMRARARELKDKTDGETAVRAAIAGRHLREGLEHGGLPLSRRLQLFGARSHRCLFLGAESFLLLGGAHRAPFVRSTTCAKRSSRCSHVLMPSKA